MNTSCIDRQHPQRPGGTVPIVRERQSARGMTTTWWHSLDLIIGIFPDCYGPPQPDWPPQMKLAGFPMLPGWNTVAFPREATRRFVGSCLSKML
jgi:hypothetical protein